MSKQIKKVTNSVGTFLGLSGPKTQNYQGPTNFRTPFSSSIDGTVNLDPSIRSLQDKGLNQANSIYGDVGNATDRYLTQSSSLRDSLNTNNGAFIQARVNPITQRYGTLRASTQQNLNQRGLSGSSFYDQSMSNLNTDQGRDEGDARAQATMESIAAQSGIDQNSLNAVLQKATLQAGLNNENYQVATTRLQQELASLGLGAQQIQQAMNAWAQNQQNNLAGYGLQTNRIGTIGKTINDTFGKGGAFPGGIGA
jgi:hypothetical protein